MTIGIIGNKEIHKGLIPITLPDGLTVQWVDSPTIIHNADCYIDLFFEKTDERINHLKLFGPAIIIVNSPCHTFNELPDNYIRINGWPGFLENTIIEAASKNIAIQPSVEKVFTGLGKTVEWVPDKPGFIAARVITMIINEAYLALEEGVSSKEEIDIAMKLGTNYPYGPFEWSEKIGLRNIYNLLKRLSISSNRYQPAALLKKEALS